MPKNEAAEGASAPGYPPYNIEKTGEDAYRLTMAVAGFSEDELGITAQENTLLVTGKAKKEEDENRYLHRGIARRAFERRFSLADHIKVVGASLVNKASNEPVSVSCLTRSGAPIR